MKIKDLLVEKIKKKTAIYYHGTKLKHVRSILKHGLIPNPKERNYDETSGGWETFEGGIYLAKDIRDAKAHGSEIIITVQFVLGSGTIDEDDVVEKIEYIIEELQDKKPSDENYLDILKDVIELRIENKQLHKNFFNVISSFIEMTIESYPTNIDDVWDEFNNDFIRSDVIVDTMRETTEYKDLINAAFKYMKPSKKELPKTIRIERPIGFSGKTKILKIENIKSGEVYYSSDINEAVTKFHGGENSRFIIGHGGKNSNTFSGSYDTKRYGVFFTDNKDFAELYGEPKKFVLNIKKTLDLDDNGSKDLLYRFYEIVSRIDRNMMFEVNRILNYGPVWQLFENDIGKLFYKFLRKNGYDSAKFVESHDVDGEEVLSETIVVLDLYKIRQDRDGEPDLFDE
jgi:hypothetical protein